jgi:hypothetical protein
LITRVPGKHKINYSALDSPPDATGMAIMFFFIDHENTFGHLPRETIAELGNEASEVSMLAPLWYPPQAYSPSEFKKMWKNIERKMKHISVDSKNQFKIKGSSKTYSPMQIAALLYWVVYRLSDRDLANKTGFGWIRSAEMMMRHKKHGVIFRRKIRRKSNG